MYQNVFSNHTLARPDLMPKLTALTQTSRGGTRRKGREWEERNWREKGED